MNSRLLSLVLQFWNVKKSGEFATMNKPKYLWAVMACMCFCTGLTSAAPKKNSKKLSDHNSDLIPIPDDLLESYNMPSGKPKFQSRSFFVKSISRKFSWKANYVGESNRPKSKFRTTNNTKLNFFFWDVSFFVFLEKWVVGIIYASRLVLQDGRIC